MADAPARTSPRGRILAFYRMLPSERRAHAVQVSRATSALAKAGADVTLTIRRGEDAAGEGIAPGTPLAEAAAAGVRIAPIRWRSRTRWRLELPLVRARWNGAAGEAGFPARPVVFVREVAPYSVILARAANRWGLPFIHEAHNLKCVVTEEERGADAARQAEALERELFDRADGVIFTAPLIEGMARERFGFRAQALVAPNGAPVVYEPEPGVAPPARDLEILYAGQLYRWKGFDLLLQALAAMPGRRLTVAGGALAPLPSGPEVALEGAPGSQSALEEARKRAAELGIGDRVSFLGQVPPGEALALMRRARVSVIPLPAEGSAEARWFTAPLKLFELWASGTPVVVTDLPSLRALVRDGENALVAPAEPAALAASLTRLLDDPALASRLAAAGRTQATARSWDARAKAILNFFDRALGASS